MSADFLLLLPSSFFFFFFRSAPATSMPSAWASIFLWLHRRLLGFLGGPLALSVGLVLSSLALFLLLQGGRKLCSSGALLLGEVGASISPPRRAERRPPFRSWALRLLIFLGSGLLCGSLIGLRSLPGITDSDHGGAHADGDAQKHAQQKTRNQILDMEYAQQYQQVANYEHGRQKARGGQIAKADVHDDAWDPWPVSNDWSPWQEAEEKKKEEEEEEEKEEKEEEREEEAWETEGEQLLRSDYIEEPLPWTGAELQDSSGAQPAILLQEHPPSPSRTHTTSPGLGPRGPRLQQDKGTPAVSATTPQSALRRRKCFLLCGVLDVDGRRVASRSSAAYLREGASTMSAKEEGDKETPLLRGAPPPIASLSKNISSPVFADDDKDLRDNYEERTMGAFRPGFSAEAPPPAGLLNQSDAASQAAAALAPDDPSLFLVLLWAPKGWFFGSKGAKGSDLRANLRTWACYGKRWGVEVRVVDPSGTPKCAKEHERDPYFRKTCGMTLALELLLREDKADRQWRQDLGLRGPRPAWLVVLDGDVMAYNPEISPAEAFLGRDFSQVFQIGACLPYRSLSSV